MRAQVAFEELLRAKVPSFGKPEQTHAGGLQGSSWGRRTTQSPRGGRPSQMTCTPLRSIRSRARGIRTTTRWPSPSSGCIRQKRCGPWKGVEDVEFATLEWVAWYNTSRLLEPIGHVPPNKFERGYYDRQTAPAEPAALT